MNTPVSFEIKQLLYYRGWRYELGVDETGYRVEHSLAEQRWNEGDLTYVDITIADIVMWLYEKHEYWCYVYTNGKIWHPCIQHKFGDMAVLSGKIGESNSPTEAYEAAIEYTLKNLL